MTYSRLIGPAYAALAIVASSALTGCGSDDEQPPAVVDDSGSEETSIDSTTDAADSAIGTDDGVDASDASSDVGDTSDTTDTTIADTALDVATDAASDAATDTAVDTSMCASGSDCPGVDTECGTRTCMSGVCGTSFVADGVGITAQTAGDCKKVVCNGAGGTKTVNDDSDVPVDTNGCTKDVCTSGVPSHPLEPVGTACTGGTGKVCSSTGACVACNVDTDCVAPNTCNTTTHACVGPASCTDGLKNGTETDVDCGGSCPNDCKVGKGCSSGADCESTICAGSLCQGPSVRTVSPSFGAKGVATSAPIVITFAGPMDGTTLTANTLAGPCTGSIRVSSDDFATCIGLGSFTLAGGNTVASFVPQGSLSFNTKYKLRVTNAAKDGFGNALIATWNSDFESVAPAVCDTPARTVVISQVYAGGGAAGALYNRDYVELHNRGTTSIDVTGWSVQTGPVFGGAATQKIDLTGSIPAGGYLLVGGTVGTEGADPAADITGTFAISESSARIQLFASSTLTTSCSGHVDEVGFGTGVCFEGGYAPTPGVTNALFRRDAGGCSDGNNNSFDFFAAAPAPRRSTTAPLVCIACQTRNGTGLPTHADYCAIMPAGTAFDIATTASVATRPIYAQIDDFFATPATGPSPSVIAQIGYGPPTINPSSQSGFTWTTASYSAQVGTKDEYTATLTVATPGTYRYVARFSMDSGDTWTYCDKNGAGDTTGPFEVVQMPTLSVDP